jgi:putative FmdB family regulatory protein
MPVYEFKCVHCDHEFERVLRVSTITDFQKRNYSIKCDNCYGTSVIQLISKPNIKVFQGQRLVNLCDDAPYVGSMRDVKDEINKFNDSEFGSKWRVALSDQ